MKSLARCVGPAALLAVGLALPLLAFENPLSSTSIRDAYFLGKDGGQRAEEFLARYIVYPPQPKSGQFFVVMIQVKTPFIMVMERPTQLISYSAPQAEQDFLGKPAGFAIRVQVNKTPSYRGGSVRKARGGFETVPGPGWRDMKYLLSQNDQEIMRKSMHAEPICIGTDGCTFVGWDINLDYDAEKIQSAPIRFEVIMPDGQSVATSFDLDQLR